MSQERKQVPISEFPPGVKPEDYLFAQSVVNLAGVIAEWFENRKARANLRKDLGLENPPLKK